MEDKPLTTRTIKASLLLAPVIFFLFGAFGHKNWAWGFALGASLSLFSFITLKIVVPMLFMPGSPPYVKAILGLTLWMKMPVICVILYIGTHVPSITPGAMVPGIAFIPGVIVLRAIGDMMFESGRSRRAAAMMHRASLEHDTVPIRSARKTHAAEPLSEGA